MRRNDEDGSILEEDQSDRTSICEICFEESAVSPCVDCKNDLSEEVDAEGEDVEWEE